MAKAAHWTITDAEARKLGEQTGLDTLGSPSPKRWMLSVIGTQSDCAEANAIKHPAWGVRSQG